MRRWTACELHTHTNHSDGRQTLRELAAGAKALGFDCIALTDHNTISGLIDREFIERETGLTIVPGMEWTTFYGHMLTIGAYAFVDWRKATRTNISEGIEDVHRAGGLAGLAHPFRPGSPICTGCYWEFDIRDWGAVDYIEVWSGTFPSIKRTNARAFDLWTERLNAGFRIAAVSGRDWHEQSRTEEPVAVTYLQTDEADGETDDRRIVQALRAGRATVTIGPLLALEAETDGERYGIGSVVPLRPANRERRRTGSPSASSAGEAAHSVPEETVQPARAALTEDAEPCAHVRFRAAVSFHIRQGLWELPEQSYTLRLTGSSGIIAERRIGGADAVHKFDYPAGGEPSWARAELHGVVRGVRTLIAFTNAIYFDNGTEERA